MKNFVDRHSRIRSCYCHDQNPENYSLDPLVMRVDASDRLTLRHFPNNEDRRRNQPGHSL